MVCLTVDRPSSPGVRQLSVGEVRVSVRGERGVLGVRGEGRVSQALQPLGGGVGIATPERWQQLSASNIQASRSFSLSQSKTRYTWFQNERVYKLLKTLQSQWQCCEGLMNASFLYQANMYHVLGAVPQQWKEELEACLPFLLSACPSACAGLEASVPRMAGRTEWENGWKIQREIR